MDMNEKFKVEEKVQEEVIVEEKLIFLDIKEGKFVKVFFEKVFYVEGEVICERCIKFIVLVDRIYEFFELVSEKFEMFMQISVVDWFKEGQFEVNYQFWSVSESVYVFVKIRVLRDEVKFLMVMDIWLVVEIYEREVYEFFWNNF